MFWLTVRVTYARAHASFLFKTLSQGTVKDKFCICAQGKLRSAGTSAQLDLSALGALWVAKVQIILHRDREISDQT